MKVIGCDGREYNWPKYVGFPVTKPGKSKLHVRTRNLLYKLYPTQVILEEVHIPGSKLHLDFVLLTEIMAIEVQGAQHTKYTPHFHGNPIGFFKARMNDAAKRRWCEQNNIRLVELPHTETDDEWSDRIQS
jgi:hypothetical protein